jgi:hypothetical protein
MRRPNHRQVLAAPESCRAAGADRGLPLACRET